MSLIRLISEQNNMKTVKNKIFVVLMASVLALPAMAAFGDQEQPNAVFQSTSTLSPSGSVYSSNPILDEDGTANNPASQAPSRGPRKLPDLPSTENESDNTPIGDAALPLLVFAAAAAATVAIRNRRRQVAE